MSDLATLLTRIRAATAALPRTLPQILFALVMLGVGAATGRATRGGVDADLADLTFEDGEGI